MSDAGTPPTAGPPPNPRRGRQRFLVGFLDVSRWTVAGLAALALVLPERIHRPLAIAMVVLLIVVPVVRITWLVLRWARLGDWRFAAAGSALLLVLAVGLAVAR
jgi:hypothetical protein